MTDIPESADVKARFQGLLSFRGEGAPSLQIVIAIVGFVVHMGELLSGKATCHLDLRKRLAKTTARDFLYYKVVS